MRARTWKVATGVTGRRDRNKRLKQERIFAAAAELFGAEPYEAVTVQRIADLADVGVGTLFRYVETKAELLLMVLNEGLAQAVDAGEQALEAAADTDPQTRVRLLLEPMLSWAHAQGVNLLQYQKEVLFGTPDDQYRAIAIELGERIERAIARAIGREHPTEAQVVAARMLYSAIVLETARAVLLGQSARTLAHQTFDQAAIVIRGASPAT